MNKLVDMLMADKNLSTLFTYEDFAKKGYKKVAFEKELNEGIEKKYIDRIYGGIYTLDVKYRKTAIPRKVLSQMIEPHSYVSMRFVLYEYDWIPEMIFSVSCVTTGEKRTVETGRYGTFIYTPLYEKLPESGVYTEDDFQGKCREARPLRALCDLLYFEDRNYPWCFENLYEVHRIFKYSLEEDLTSRDFDELQEDFEGQKIGNLLKETRKELGL